MNYNFTDRVRKVLAMARKEAIRLHHDYVGTEHILLGLIHEGEGAGVEAAVQNGLVVDMEQVQETVEESVRRGKAAISPSELPYTSGAKKVLEFAMAEARELNHFYVGAEHLLRGLVREEEEKGNAVHRSHRPVPSASLRWPHTKRVPRASKQRARSYGPVRVTSPRKRRSGPAASRRSVGRRASRLPADTPVRPPEPELSRWMLFWLEFLRALGPQHAMILLAVALVAHPPALDAPTVATIATSVWATVRPKQQGSGPVRPNQQQAAHDASRSRGERQ